MFRLMIFAMSLFLITGIGCEHSSNNLNPNVEVSETNETRALNPCYSGNMGTLEVNSIAAEDGYIISIYDASGHSYVVNAAANGTVVAPLRVGKLDLTSSLRYYRSILSFDTSAIPDCASITYINLNITPLYGYDLDYLIANLVIEIAGSTGFSGSYALTSADYAATSLESVNAWVNPMIGGFMLHYNDDGSFGGLTPYINKQGITQLRLRLRTYPQSRIVNIVGYSFIGVPMDPVPNITIDWIVE